MIEIVKILFKDYFEFVAFISSLFYWLAMKQFSWVSAKSTRRLSLIVLFVSLFYIFKRIVPLSIAKFDIIDLDIMFRKTIAMTKGTDWVEGFLYGIATCVYAGIVLLFLLGEMKSSKKKKKPE